METKLRGAALISILMGLLPLQLHSSHSAELAEADPALRALFAQRVLADEYYDLASQRLLAGKVEDFVFGKVRSAFPNSSWADNYALTNAIINDANKYAFDPLYILAVIQTESSFNPRVRGRHGEIGLMQIRPQTARWVAKKFNLELRHDRQLMDPVKSVQIGIRYLYWLQTKFDDPRHSTTAYNMGPGNLRKLLAKNVNPGIYYSKVAGRYKALYKQFSKKSGTPAGERPTVIAIAN